MSASESSTPAPKPGSKRQRIRKACDDCRGRKVKCDGELPCEACINYNQTCTYSNEKSRYGGPMYAEELERRNERLQQALMHFAPGLDIKALMSSGLEPYSLPAPDPSLLITPNPSPINGSPPAKQNELVDTMIEATDRLAIDGRGRCDYLGDFAGLAFLDRISERCCQLLNRNMEKDISSKLFPSQDLSPLCLERHLLATSRTKLLPPKTVATYLTGIAIGDACCLLRFIHQPTFEDQLDRIYDLSPEQYNPEDEAFLGLLYTTLAIGEIFAGKSPGVNEAPENADEPKGAVFFRAGQVLVNNIDCRDITSLQTLLCMVIYYQSLGQIQLCYSSISLAVASAFRMGLHQSSVLKLFDPIQQEVRKRTFFALQTMDTYVATMLGLPKSIRADDLDQDLPLDVDDQFLTADCILPMPANHTSMMAVSNAHTRLLLIMANVVAYIYPNQKQLNRKSSYQVDYSRVVQVEADLNNWLRTVEETTLSTPITPKVEGMQLLLRLAYAHVQMVLYRPFIQHLIRSPPSKAPDMRCYACASACVKASMQVIWIVDHMDKEGLLIGAYWFTVYITFFAVMSLCMFNLGNQNDPTAAETMSAAVKGREILARLSGENDSAKRSIAGLGDIFDRISSRHVTPTPAPSEIPSDLPITTPPQPSSSTSSHPSPLATNFPPPGPPGTSNPSLSPAPNHFPTTAGPSHITDPTSPLAGSYPYSPAWPTSTTPLAAYGASSQEEGNGSFHVFPPAWLDQGFSLGSEDLEFQPSWRGSGSG